MHGKSGKRYFAEIAACLIKKTAGAKAKPLVLFVDTTNTGNAVNNILKAIRLLMRIKQVPTFCAEVIGIVNGTVNTSCHRTNAIRVKRCCRPTVGVLPPSGWQPSKSDVRNRQPVIFCRDGRSVAVEYWVVDNIPTEDQAGLLGAKGLHDILRVQPQTQAGSIVVKYACGGTKDISGGNAPGSTLMNMLAESSKSAAWKALRMGPSMQAVGVDGGRLLELILSDQKSPGSVANDLLKKSGLLDCEEIYYLISRSETNQCTSVRKKVVASIRNHKDKTAVREACRSAIHAHRTEQP